MIQSRVVNVGSCIHSFHWHVQNATIPCRSQELLPFHSVIYSFLPPLSTNYSSILPCFILPSISWSTAQTYCFKINICLYIYIYTHTLLGILFSSILCTCPNQHNLLNLIISVLMGFLNDCGGSSHTGICSYFLKFFPIGYHSTNALNRSVLYTPLLGTSIVQLV
jgi:hypothetical protein